MEGPLCLPCCSYSYSASGIRSPASDCRLLFFSDSRPPPFSSKCSISGRFQHGFLAVKQQHSWKATVVRASGDPGSSPRPVVGPAELKTPTGQVLSEIMRSHPHLLSFTIDEELKKLCSNRDAQKKEAASHSPDDLLYTRIAELKEKERRQAIEDIMYCLIVQKFGDRGIYMMPKLITSSSPEAVTLIDAQYEPKLESVHSPDVLEIVESHVSMVLGSGNLGHATTIQMSKLKLGKLYAASIMDGYFLKRIDERYQLERTTNTLPKMKNFPNMLNTIKPNPFMDLDSLVQITPDNSDGFEKAGDERDCTLKDYMIYLDTETLQRYATIRSKEAVAVIEKQTQALFGPPDIVVSGDGKFGTVHDEIVTVTSQGLITLILEATIFGSFLWEAEEYTENKHHIVES